MSCCRHAFPFYFSKSLCCSFFLGFHGVFIYANIVFCLAKAKWFIFFRKREVKKVDMGMMGKNTRGQ